MTLPKFKYFNRPDLYSMFLDEECACDICGRHKPCFDASFYFGEDSLETLCPDCLAKGKLKDMDVFTCEGDMEALIRQLKTLHPELAADALQEMAVEKTVELEKTTPKLLSWQDWPWPCAEGDYCAFLGFGSKALFNRLSEGEGYRLFERSLHPSLEESGAADEWWKESLPDKAIEDLEASRAFDSLFYVFRSLHSGTLVTMWDML